MSRTLCVRPFSSLLMIPSLRSSSARSCAKRFTFSICGASARDWASMSAIELFNEVMRAFCESAVPRMIRLAADRIATGSTRSPVWKFTVTRRWDFSSWGAD